MHQHIFIFWLCIRCKPMLPCNHANIKSMPHITQSDAQGEGRAFSKNTPTDPRQFLHAAPCMPVCLPHLFLSRARWRRPIRSPPPGTCRRSFSCPLRSPPSGKLRWPPLLRPSNRSFKLERCPFRSPPPDTLRLPSSRPLRWPPLLRRSNRSFKLE